MEEKTELAKNNESKEVELAGNNELKEEAELAKNNEQLTMREVSRRLGVSSQQLRRYCNSGFVPGMRAMMTGKHRSFTPEQVDWLKQAIYLKRAGFTTRDLRKYVQLCQQMTADAMKERMAMIRTHKRQVWQELEELQETIDFLERQEEMSGE